MSNKIKKTLPKWECVGFFGYGQGRAVAEFGEDAVKGKSVCHEICSMSDKCRDSHAARMDARFPEVADIVKRTVATALGTGIPVVGLVVSAMNVAIKRESVEALRIRESLKRFEVDGMTDHYVLGQLENLDNGISKRQPGTKESLVLVGSSANLKEKA